MNNKKIIIAGGSGFIGQEMIKYFGKENSVIILTRQTNNEKNNRNQYTSLKQNDLQNVKFVKWNGYSLGKWGEELNNSDIIINLSGKTVNCRYTEKNKKEILDSRTNATKVIGQAILQCSTPPTLWINASSATIYRHAIDKPQNEYMGEITNDFSVQVCKLWEKAFNDQDVNTRKVILRMAITLGPSGVLIPYFNLLKFHLGGKQGNGKQMFSWIHIEDTCRMIKWIFEHKEMKGAYNCCSPNPVTNKELMRTLCKVTDHKIELASPAWLLKAGAFLIRTEPELVLKSRWVIPTRILESGFQFKYPYLLDALKEIINNVPRKQYHLF